MERTEEESGCGGGHSGCFLVCPLVAGDARVSLDLDQLRVPASVGSPAQLLGDAQQQVLVADGKQRGEAVREQHEGHAVPLRAVAHTEAMPDATELAAHDGLAAGSATVRVHVQSSVCAFGSLSYQLMELLRGCLGNKAKEVYEAAQSALTRVASSDAALSQQQTQCQGPVPHEDLGLDTPFDALLQSVKGGVLLCQVMQRRMRYARLELAGMAYGMRVQLTHCAAGFHAGAEGADTAPGPSRAVPEGGGAASGEPAQGQGRGGGRRTTSERGMHLA